MPLARIKGQETRWTKEGISVDEMQSAEIMDVIVPVFWWLKSTHVNRLGPVRKSGGVDSYETRGPVSTPRKSFDWCEILHCR